MRGYQQAPRVHELKDKRMRGYQQAPGVHEPKDMNMWGCEDTNKYTEYMSLRINVRIRGNNSKHI